MPKVQAPQLLSPHPARSARRRWAALSLLLCTLSACQPADSPAEAKPKAPAPEVGVVVVARSDAPLELELPARLSASQVADVRPQVTGVVTRRLFQEGGRVKAGQPLYQLDDAAFAAERTRAAAALQKAEAAAAQARVRAERDAQLLRADAISRQQADDSAAVARQAEADVAVAKAALEAATVQWTRARIVAPIGGRVDLSTVTVGALVTANQVQALTTVQQLDPMQVDLVQSSGELLQMRQQMDAGKRVPLRLQMEDGSLYAHAGELKVRSVAVDRNTGAVTLRASVPNPDGVLLPGMSVTAKVQVGRDADVVLVPQQGISRSPTGEAVALVVAGEENLVERRRVVLGRAVGNRWIVLQGLKPGEKLIVEGQQRARPKQPVKPVPVGSGGKGEGKGDGKGATSGRPGVATPAASAAASAASKG